MKSAVCSSETSDFDFICFLVSVLLLSFSIWTYFIRPGFTLIDAAVESGEMLTRSWVRSNPQLPARITVAPFTFLFILHDNLFIILDRNVTSPYISVLLFHAHNTLVVIFKCFFSFPLLAHLFSCSPLLLYLSSLSLYLDVYNYRHRFE